MMVYELDTPVGYSTGTETFRPAEYPNPYPVPYAAGQVVSMAAPRVAYPAIVITDQQNRILLAASMGLGLFIGAWQARQSGGTSTEMVFAGLVGAAAGRIVYDGVRYIIVGST